MRVPDADTDPRTEVGQVGAALNRMLGHVAAALAARQASETRVRQFVADASHELRTPLAAIRGYAELTRRSREPVPAGRRARAGPGRVGERPDDRPGRGPAAAGPAGLRPAAGAREPVDLTRLVVDAVSDAQRRRPGPPLACSTCRTSRSSVRRRRAPGCTRCWPTCWPTRAPTPRRAPPSTIRLCHSRTDPPCCEVADDGPGIPAELQPEVFERFARGDRSRSRAAGSTGLGLAIVAAVVDAHGGTVGVESRPAGTTFTVRLPSCHA